MVVRPRAVGTGIGGNQLRGPDQAVQAAGILLGHNLPILVEDEPHQVAVFLHFVPQTLGIVAVELDMPVKGFHLFRAVEAVVAVAGLIVRQQVAAGLDK